jgi:large subunit ribosomal protein L15
VKVLGSGELKTKVNVSVHAISESAKQKIEALGGSVTIVK